MQIQALYVKPGYQPKLTEVEDDLLVLQQMVDGYIEPVCIGRNLVALVNEDGLSLGMNPNFSIGYTTLVGPVLIVQDKGNGNYESLSSSQVKEAWQIVREGRGYDRPVAHCKRIC